ncbi:hypothetical protein F7230_04600 [Corynebacterium sp. 320]|uniref:hypothetical protein n=1 Tax=Corynebacterium TaxID=1716 RepID=UPI00125CCBF9|nr:MULTISPECIES: hypothetical protein [Corynebacterium]KAB1504362.1 hypothetical protein F7230_04600 [Corynebacterium sp. 320]KAB1552540.1 hypothetical protein F7233_02000 [Corynebacterium sp. 321]KAB3528498.1 hypothetical protein F8354_04600 [Corynebacterium sp. 250]QNP92039.1 hypothetical protein IAU67_08465 [Corynebacterium zhongnanshanii]
MSYEDLVAITPANVDLSVASESMAYGDEEGAVIDLLIEARKSGVLSLEMIETALRDDLDKPYAELVEELAEAAGFRLKD